MKVIQRFLILFICIFALAFPINVYAGEIVPDVTIKNGEVALNANSVQNADEAKGTIIERYKGLVTFFGGLAAITMVAIFIKHFIELGIKASNQMERKQLTSGLVWSGIAAACLGSVTFLFSIVYGVFK